MQVLNLTMRILIIKLGAKGDIVRTLPILSVIKQKCPNSEITWITKPEYEEILKKNPYIYRILTLPVKITENFDILYNFDIDDEATEIALKTKADKKYGFYCERGYPATFNPSAEYYLNTLFDDELKKTNKKTYQQMMFEVAELPYKKEQYFIHLTNKDKKYVERFVGKNNINVEKLIGIHLGASSRWPSKVWHKNNLKEFIIKADKKGYKILLFGGPNEVEKHKKLIKELEEEGTKVYKNNPNNSFNEFSSLVSICNQMICSDSMSLHVSLALKKPTICLFFCTSSNEIEGYGLLKKIVSPKLYEFFPEKMDQYDEELTKSISADEVLNALESPLLIRVVNAIIKHIEEEKFLVIKRKEGIHSGKWAFPGGVVEKGESDEIALRREIKEETGLEIDKIIKKISEYTYPREDGTKTCGVCYLVNLEDKDVKINEEIEDFKWITIEEFEELDFINGLYEELLEALIELKNFKI